MAERNKVSVNPQPQCLGEPSTLKPEAGERQTLLRKRGRLGTDVGAESPGVLQRLDGEPSSLLLFFFISSSLELGDTKVCEP